ncbi:MAG: pyrroline-5-carboxylate reductase [Alphaproteobacteria bacterium]|nr:pyrroline-5-carboxylate reductase [Alphaproteobacteria bacterium]
MTQPSTINQQPATSLLLIGCGNMGSALLKIWRVKTGILAMPIRVVEPNAVESHPNVSWAKQISELPENFLPDIIVLAVKPNQLEEILPPLFQKFGNRSIYLSIAAGKPISFYEQHLGKEAPVVRAMPNTPAAMAKGATGLIGNAALTQAGRDRVSGLVEATGLALWVDNESLMDTVTAISGSGPAYFFHMIECMIASGVSHGLSKEDATELAIQTCIGSGEMAQQGHTINKDVAELRRNVTSPGGTTAAALAVFEKNNALQNLIEEAVAAAINRAKEL